MPSEAERAVDDDRTGLGERGREQVQTPLEHDGYVASVVAHAAAPPRSARLPRQSAHLFLTRSLRSLMCLPMGWAAGGAPAAGWGCRTYRLVPARSEGEVALRRRGSDVGRPWEREEAEPYVRRAHARNPVSKESVTPPTSRHFSPPAAPVNQPVPRVPRRLSRRPCRGLLTRTAAGRTDLWVTSQGVMMTPMPDLSCG
ncbi:hypothetical protein Sgleb_55640 [Streptomyces glebosus]|uniref:Uncharacterized protein n=1 Tax=Streptomyces glebosus TaxID=249580 RepID=A0A640T1A1_9ACTN|nr:hypothetical protein Sgleb_55640 [Streptomyces glebosus]GHG85464.1 hypothetical protein GCM10010513_66290 [Streptomyces glebosus]